MVRESNVLLMCVVGVLVFILQFKFLYLDPRDYANLERNSFVKAEAESYLLSKGMADMSIGSPESDYYISVIAPKANDVYKSEMWMASKKGLVIFTVVFLFVSLIFNFSYIFGVVMSIPMILLVVGGSSALLLAPLVVFSLATYARKKLEVYFSSK